MVDVWLPYNRTEICARIPSKNLRDIIKVEEKPSVTDPLGEIRKSIRNSIGVKGLDNVIGAGGRVALAINIPDEALAKHLVSIFIEESSQLGLDVNNYLVVTLVNNPLTFKAPRAVKRLLDEVSSLGVNIVSHDASCESAYVGETGRGIKVYLNKIFAESEVKIVASVFEPNPYTVYDCSETGVALGLSGIETVKGILAPALNSDRAGEIIFENSIEVSRAAGITFSIHILRNPRGDMIKAFAGDPKETFQESLKAADSTYRVNVDRRYDLVIVSSGGAPFDGNILSACGCLENALRVVKRGGVIVLVAECSEGYGDAGLHKMVRGLGGDLDSLEKSLTNNISASGFALCRLLRALKRADIVMVSAIPDYYASEIPGLRVFRSVNDALKYALEKTKEDAEVAAILYGNSIILDVKEG